MMTEEERMRMELRQMQKKTGVIANESLESTRRMLEMVDEAQDTGIKTLVVLDEQGEKLRIIGEDLDNIAVNVNETEKNMTRLETFCGLLICNCRKPRDISSSEVVYNKKKKESRDNRQDRKRPSPNSTSPDRYILRVMNDAREDEMENNMCQVAVMVENLKSMATDMGNELERQDKTIEQITEKAGSNVDRIAAANKHAEEILI